MRKGQIASIQLCCLARKCYTGMVAATEITMSDSARSHNTLTSLLVLGSKVVSMQLSKQ